MKYSWHVKQGISDINVIFKSLKRHSDSILGHHKGYLGQNIYNNNRKKPMKFINIDVGFLFKEFPVYDTFLSLQGKTCS